MDWWTRLVGGAKTEKKPPSRSSVHDPQTRLAKFKREYQTILQLCNRPRAVARQETLLGKLRERLDHLCFLVREEARAPLPHLSLQFASANRIYTVFTRAATVSGHEPVIASTVAVLAALVDSEEEDFLGTSVFAKSLTRLATKVLDSSSPALIGSDTETAILELLFTIAAKIRLQPEILHFWFESTANAELEDVFVKEKKSFIGITQKADFPLCYLLIDRVHHDGRIGDFARTGLLYIFEATGRSPDLEEWVVSSDLPTLLASGLGALYSQLSRELDIAHPEAMLPATLAMSDYSTAHPRGTAESAFSDRHQNHMNTFLSYLAFWQDVLDHCRSSDVKDTLIDHFQILFLRQLLYPSLLQSSDTDAGSSVAVLTYLTAMLESLDYPDLMAVMLRYLLDLGGNSHPPPPQTRPVDQDPVPTTPVKPTTGHPRSPTSLKRRQSLLLLTAPRDPEDAVDPNLFNLVDLILNNIRSRNDQSVYAVMKLVSTMMTRQKQFALQSLLEVQKSRLTVPLRARGAFCRDVHEYIELAQSLHDHAGLTTTYTCLVEDAHHAIDLEAQSLSSQQKSERHNFGGVETFNTYLLPLHNSLLRGILKLLRSFWTNSMDVNLALTQAIVSIARSCEIRLEGWLTADPSKYEFAQHKSEYDGRGKHWRSALEEEELDAFNASQEAARWPQWSPEYAPPLFQALRDLSRELGAVRRYIPDLQQLLNERKSLLQDTMPDAYIDEASGSTLQSSASDPAGKNGVHSPMFRKNKAIELEHPAYALEESQLRAQNGAVFSNDSDRSASLPRLTSADVLAVGDAKAGKIFLQPVAEASITTDVLMRVIDFPAIEHDDARYIGSIDDNIAGDGGEKAQARTASLNHVLTSVVVLQEFILELVAVMQVRAAVLGEREVRFV